MSSICAPSAGPFLWNSLTRLTATQTQALITTDELQPRADRQTASTTSSQLEVLTAATAPRCLCAWVFVGLYVWECVCAVPLFDSLEPLLLQVPLDYFRIRDNGSHSASSGHRALWSPHAHISGQRAGNVRTQTLQALNGACWNTDVWLGNFHPSIPFPCPISDSAYTV